MSLDELSVSQKDELRAALWVDSMFDGEHYGVAGRFPYPWSATDEDLEEFFGGVCFVEEDFYSEA